MDEEIRHFGDFADKWTTVLAILVIMVVLAVFVLVVTLPSKPNSSITTSISNRATTVSTISSTTTANLERLSIANYSYNSEVGLFSGSEQVPVSNGFVSGRLVTYTSQNSSLVIRTLTYSDSKTANAAYDYISNFSGSGATYIKNMPKDYIGVILKSGSSELYGIIFMKNYSIYTATVTQTPGRYINPNATISTMLYAINNTA